MSKGSFDFVRIVRGLMTWFARQKRVLPWRDQPTLYRVWVSEIMLQQTQVATVIPYFERFMERFPTVQALARAPEEDVLRLWAGLGYYSRARRLHGAARQIVENLESGGQGFPVSREEWLKVPGVGHYTAGAILSIALNQPEAILDGNVERVLSRVCGIDRERGDAQYKEQLWRRSEAWVRDAHGLKAKPGEFNQALMELGALTCVPRNPRCEVCPVGSDCHAYRLGKTDVFPPPRKRPARVEVREEAHCYIHSDEVSGVRVLVRLRQKGEWRAGLWDLLEKSEMAAEEAQKNLVRLGKVETRHVVTQHQIFRTTEVWRVRLGKFVKKYERLSDYRWISPSAPEVGVGSAFKKTWEKICAELEV